MAEIITLSSEDEEESVVVPKKRIKLTTLSSKIEDSCIVVLDDDDDDCKEVKIQSEPTPDKTQTRTEENAASKDAECVNIPENNTKDSVVESDPLKVKDSVVESDPLKVSTGNTDCDGDNLNNSRLPSEAPPEENKTENPFLSFLDGCLQALKAPEDKGLLEAKLPIIKKLYEKLNNLDHDFNELNDIIANNAGKIKNAPQETVIRLSEVYQWLKASYKAASQAKQSSEHNLKIIKKLEKALLKIRRKIRELEAAEIDFDDEENSAYMQMDRYMTRASQIYTKLCKYREENPHHGCLLYCRLDFSKSEYSEINRALNKKYRNNKVFPTYHDVDHCIRKCVQENQINVSEDDLKCEIKHCFEELGKLLQRRRKMDLYNNQRGYIENTTDPALENPDILYRINANRTEANKKLEAVIEKYARLQEKGVDPELSSESEDSHAAESGSECEQDENATENI